jgi:hypothetical protein
MKHKVSILWGETPDYGNAAVTYEFETEAEASAFRLGVEEMSGWLGYEEVAEGYIYTYEEDEA